MVKYTDKEFTEFIKNSLSIAEVLRKMGLKATGGNYSTVNKRIEKLKIDKSHFTGGDWNQGDRYRSIKEAQPLKEILIENSHFTNNHYLKKIT